MSKNLFVSGEEVVLLDMLEARERRQEKQMNLLKSNDSLTLVSMTMNIPGSIKVVPEITQIFDYLFEELTILFKDCLFLKELHHDKTGHEGYFLLEKEKEAIKKQLIMLEETANFGRLFDLDVVSLVNGNITLISRNDFGLTPRKCFICNENAKACGRNRTHSVEELQLAISEYIEERRDMLND
ncbi:citrate lyase holo-[acyl-carrier protein] synthase [Vagococcus carniphilus]|uniref:citrate lyase holo-[acyl-carrier protein] synthase n=1 Tax=Vagococcus carniphilus TaxID=218144 RepID=A0AAW8U2Z8_9ENTE|nr:citrate lyase holo-[acyl-carrier protein] synthase [Vagococcus carniphilus]MDT2829334.1 citrate lyase holo-[acyl-carrier protein] synthase [Vagococcus carniphilus]MDT2833459.1 citrate lyase holo-[acyl-carrier protein] synthase [Vagococcus carniphilus]MDT2838793.1 citrate lyase holo-[acyl-carrier protein] synthase [Vagococcus carniphilus]MDT2852851.1 citrate lyase holo-[acyl-carrier protein] synthase [Vagococcus carniphilus]